MILITFDIIDSKSLKIPLAKTKDLDSYLMKVSKNYQIKENNIELNNGDQIRILVTKQNIIEIIFDVLTFLVANNLKARVFVSNGKVDNLKYLRLSEAMGDVFYKNVDLEKLSKNDLGYYKQKNCSIRYLGNENTKLIDTMFLVLSKLALKKENNIAIVYYYLFKKETQIEIAKRYNISQVAVNKRLKTSEVKLAKKVIDEINLLLKGETRA